MAQLYKMTLYVCDLEDSLSLDEIETLIKQDALDGVAVNCLCHFADSQIGEQIEWDDDVDINRCDCLTTAWDKYFKPPRNPQTNADRIRAMSDEELADMLMVFLVKSMGNSEFAEVRVEFEDGYRDALLNELKQPVKDGEGE